MTQAVIFMAIVPVALLMVLGLVLFGGRLRPETRVRVERAMAGVFYPLITLYWLWRSATFAGEGNLLGAVAMIVVAGVFGWMGVQAVRSGRLAPFASRQL